MRKINAANTEDTVRLTQYCPLLAWCKNTVRLMNMAPTPTSFNSALREETLNTEGGKVEIQNIFKMTRIRPVALAS